MAKATLYTLTGLPYSGKTTLTKELVNRFGFKVVHMDDAIEEQQFDVDKMSQEDWNYVYSEGYRKLKEYLASGESVILDCGNLVRSERETARQIAEVAGVNHKLIYLNLTKDQVDERWNRNRITKERDQLTDTTMSKAQEMFEEPTPDEEPVLYNSAMNLADWIENNISSV